MSFMHALRHRFGALFGRARDDRDLEDEIAFHLDLEAMHGRQDGLAPDAAIDAARRHFGNATRVREETRRMAGIGTIDVLRQDLRYGSRSLRRNPVFTTVAVGSIALGVGATTAVFGLIHSTLLARLPVPHPEQLVRLTVM